VALPDRHADPFALHTEGGMPSGAWWPSSADGQKAWMKGWWKFIFPGVFLFYLLNTVCGIEQYSSGVAAVAGYAVLVAFIACYLQAMPLTWGGVHGRFWWFYGGMLVLFAAEVPFAHQHASVMLTYVVVLTVSSLAFRALPLVALYFALAVGGPALVPGWEVGFDTDEAVALPIVALAMFGFFGVVQANRALSAAREEVARLAAENERTRIARDLHDLLGHSLTTITVKAALAHRLVGRDVDRAAREMAEVEALSRQALAEVRAAVADYREVTLAGELATGRELLTASQIDARFPDADAVAAAGPHRQLFGWVVREGLTNVVRHARATSCTVALGPDWIEIADDGAAGHGRGRGNGLKGLGERVAVAGGTVAAGPAQGGGWRLRVDMTRQSVGAP
jgi:two-component system sensor histidine kinase DesK